MQTAITIEHNDGTDTKTLIKVGDGDALQQAMEMFQLRPEEYYQQSIKDGEGNSRKKKAINASGYNRMNRWLGVSFLSPDTILADDGTKLPNPFIERDDKTGEITRVRVRRVGIGRDAKGDEQIVDLICVYDVQLYFASDAYNKWKFKPEIGNLFPSVPEKPSGVVVHLPFGQSCLELSTKSRDVQNLIREHIDRQKYAERNAITICQRNILNQFVGTRYADDNAMVPIVHWFKSTLSSEQMEVVRQQLNDGKQVIDLGGQVIAKKSDTVEVGQDDESDIDNDE